MTIEKAIAQYRQQDLPAEIRSVLAIIASKMAMPLYLLFWAADIAYVPHLKWPFFAIRLSTIPICYFTLKLAQRINDVEKIEQVALFFALSLASSINLMIFMIGDATTPYYAGLGLVTIGALSFIPFSKQRYIVAIAGIYLPYYVITFANLKSRQDLALIGVHSFFIGGAVLICLLIRFFQEDLRLKEIASRMKLHEEIMNRDSIIQEKTDEAVKLNSLSSQFSPQVLESIKSGKINLESGSGTHMQICAIFIDIVNSTERVTRIDKDKVDRVLSKFLDDSVKILLKYDITIDKFLGDGIMAFCNAPLKRADYVARVASAAIEIKAKIKSDQDFYEKNWQKELQIRVGIAKGFANVGFYGGKRHFRSYTAIGPVINLSSRLCGSAADGQIVCDFDVFDDIKEGFDLEFIGKKNLKGFNDDVIHIYEIKSATHLGSTGEAQECEVCGSVLSLETDDKGHFVFDCRTCRKTVDLQPKNQPPAAA